GKLKHYARCLLDTKNELRPKKLQSAPKVVNARQVQREIPLTFVEVDPSTATTEPPKDAKYYGAHSSRAANEEPVIESTVPKADGKQSQVTRLENVPKPSPQPLQPAPPSEKT